MSGLELLELKQRIVSLTDEERRELSLFLYRLKMESPEWKQEMDRRLDAMDAGNALSLEQVRKLRG